MSRNLVHLISQAEIASALKQMAVEIEQDYQNRSIVFK